MTKLGAELSLHAVLGGGSMGGARGPDDGDEPEDRRRGGHRILNDIAGNAV